MNTVPSRREYLEIRAREARNKKFYNHPEGIAAGPHTICLSVNSNCFMRCRMCDIGSANRRKGKEAGAFARRYRGEKFREFPVERVRTLIEEVKDFSPTIKTNFVEPLLSRNTKKIAELVKLNGLKFYTITNGWLLEKNASWLVELNADLVRISLDGTRDVHDHIRGIRGSFDRTIRGIKTLLQKRDNAGKELPIVGICYTISNYNHFNLLHFMTEMEQQGILDKVYVNFNHLQYTTKWEVMYSKRESSLFSGLDRMSIDDISFQDFNLDILGEQISLVREKFPPDRYHYYFSPELSISDLELYYDPDQWMFPHTPCYLPWQAAQVDIDGNLGIYGHCILPSFGNIMEKSFIDVWNSKKACSIRKKLREAGSFPGCNRCIGTLYPLRGRN